MKMSLQVGGLSSVSGLSLPLGPVTRLSAGKAFHIHLFIFIMMVMVVVVVMIMNMIMIIMNIIMMLTLVIVMQKYLMNSDLHFRLNVS